MIRVRASQIFTHSADDAVAAKKQLDGGKSFTDVVTQYSTCPSKENGGDLGWMPEENASALMGDISEVDPGKVLGPIHSPYGYHILLITEVEKEDIPEGFNPDTLMSDVNKALPECHTLLFKTFHIGMPVDGYKPEETIFTVSEQHGKKIGEVLALLNKELAQNSVPTISPEDLKSKMQSGDPNLVLLDIREQWERDISVIDEALLVNKDTCEEILESLEKDKEIVLIDWKGDRSPSFQKWLGLRGFSNVKGLAGGIDAWSERIDTRHNRYDIDNDEEDYRYEDIIGGDDDH